MNTVRSAAIAACILILGCSRFANAQQVASIEIYSLPETVACGTGGYANNCQIFTARRFESVRTKGLLGQPHQSVAIPPLSVSYAVDLVRSSRFYFRSLPDDLNQRKSALIVFDWKGRPPKWISVKRLDPVSKASISDDYATNLGPGRFFYHFSFDYVGQYVLQFETRNPKLTLSFGE